MSQSPVDDFSEAALISYQQGWQALNRLLHEDRSFSGHERHCAYLNCGEGAFANVSAATGLDFAEDGRAIGTVDWNFDGLLDLWITNRTAPRVRFLLNQTETSNRFIALHLEGNGTTTNRDAIGARVAVEELERPLIRTKYAGEGFLSQSSGWMHFGLGRHNGAVQVEVKWPNGAPELFEGLEPNAFFILRQGAGSAERWTPPQESALFAGDAAAAELPPRSSEARIILPASLPLPPLKQLDAQGIASPLELEEGPTLINVWTTWCRPCHEELASWTQAAPRIRAAGLNVIAFNADEDESGRAQSAGVLEKMQFPFRSAVADPASLRALDLLQRASLDRWEAMPVPCSFLVDANGYVLAIYKGSFAVDTLLADMRLEGASPEELRNAAIPFPGVWTHDPPTPDPLRVTAQFVDFAMVQEGLDYLQKATAMDQRFRAGLFSQADFADRYLVAATLLKSQNMHEEALTTYGRARDLNPSDARVRGDLAAYHLERGRLEMAIEEWKAVLGLNPRDLEAASRLAVTQLRVGRAKEALVILDQLAALRPDQANFRYYQGLARQRTGDMKGAVEGIEQALALDPDHALAMNSIAWICATHPDAQWRDGERALALAGMLCDRTQNRNLPFLMTLAAAQAESGKFVEAVATTERARELLQGRAGGGSSSPADLATVEARLALFQTGKPYRDETL